MKHKHLHQLIDQQIFNLKWPMQLVSTQITVTVDGLEALRSEYTRLVILN